VLGEAHLRRILKSYLEYSSSRPIGVPLCFAKAAQFRNILANSLAHWRADHKISACAQGAIRGFKLGGLFRFRQSCRVEETEHIHRVAASVISHPWRASPCEPSYSSAHPRKNGDVLLTIQLVGNGAPAHP
jgi:hypothetical protein